MQINVTITGNLDIDEKRAARFALTDAGLDVPDNDGQLRVAYQALIETQAREYLHSSHVKQSLVQAEKTLDIGPLKAALVDATPAKRSTAIAAALAALA